MNRNASQRLTSFVLLQGVHAGEVAGQRLEGGGEAAPALRALHGAPRSAGAPQALPAHLGRRPAFPTVQDARRLGGWGAATAAFRGPGWRRGSPASLPRSAPAAWTSPLLGSRHEDGTAAAGGDAAARRARRRCRREGAEDPGAAAAGGRRAPLAGDAAAAAAPPISNQRGAAGWRLPSALRRSGDSDPRSRALCSSPRRGQGPRTVVK